MKQNTKAMNKNKINNKNEMKRSNENKNRWRTEDEAYYKEDKQDEQGKEGHEQEVGKKKPPSLPLSSLCCSGSGGDHEEN